MEEIKTTADLKILVAECTAYDYKVELEERKPKFKSSSSHFITTIYSMEYDPEVTKQSSSSNQVEGLSRDQVEYLLTSMKQASPAAEIRKLMGMTNASKFKKHYLDTLLEMGVIKMTQPDSPNSPTQRYVLGSCSNDYYITENPKRKNY